MHFGLVVNHHVLNGVTTSSGQCCKYRLSMFLLSHVPAWLVAAIIGSASHVTCESESSSCQLNICQTVWVYSLSPPSLCLLSSQVQNWLVTICSDYMDGTNQDSRQCYINYLPVRLRPASPGRLTGTCLSVCGLCTFPSHRFISWYAHLVSRLVPHMQCYDSLWIAGFFFPLFYMLSLDENWAWYCLFLWVGTT